MPQLAPSSIAWIGSLQVFFLFSMSIVVSPLMDKGYFRLCFNGGSAVVVATLFATSFCNTFTQLIVVQGALQGVGMGMMFSSGILVLVTYFTQHLGVATGISSAGGSFGE